MVNYDQFSDGLQGQERPRKVTLLGVAFGTDLNGSFGTNGNTNIAESCNSKCFKNFPTKARQDDVTEFHRKLDFPEDLKCSFIFAQWV